MPGINSAYEGFSHTVRVTWLQIQHTSCVTGQLCTINGAAIAKPLYFSRCSSSIEHLVDTEDHKLWSVALFLFFGSAQSFLERNDINFLPVRLYLSSNNEWCSDSVLSHSEIIRRYFTGARKECLEFQQALIAKAFRFAVVSKVTNNFNS